MKTFILRLEVDEIGRVVGVVERVRSGEKERFHSYAMLTEVVRRLVATDDSEPGPVRSTLRLRDCGASALRGCPTGSA